MRHAERRAASWKYSRRQADNCVSKRLGSRAISVTPCIVVLRGLAALFFRRIENGALSKRGDSLDAQLQRLRASVFLRGTRVSERLIKQFDIPRVLYVGKCWFIQRRNGVLFGRLAGRCWWNLLQLDEDGSNSKKIEAKGFRVGRRLYFLGIFSGTGFKRFCLLSLHCDCKCLREFVSLLFYCRYKKRAGINKCFTC